MRPLPFKDHSRMHNLIFCSTIRKHFTQNVQAESQRNGNLHNTTSSVPGQDVLVLSLGSKRSEQPIPADEHTAVIAIWIKTLITWIKILG